MAKGYEFLEQRGPTLRKGDWSLGPAIPPGAARYNEMLREAVKGQLANIIFEQSAAEAVAEGRPVNVPINIKLPQFRYKNEAWIGQGPGGSRIGDVLGNAEENGEGSGKGAGNQPGADSFDLEITAGQLEELLFEDMDLPSLRPTQSHDIASTSIDYNDRRKTGIFPLLDVKQTALANLRRNALEGRKPKFHGIQNGDLRFRTWNPDVKPESRTVVIAMRDVSSSMGEYEKYVSRTLFYWMDKFLRTKYAGVEQVFITHNTKAQEVDRDTFFRLSESGGTRVSSAYDLAWDIIRRRFDPGTWNIYPFYFTDGDNWEDDNERCLESVGKLVAASNIVGYGEIHRGGYAPLATLINTLNQINDPRLIKSVIPDRKGMLAALRTFFPKKRI